MVDTIHRAKAMLNDEHVSVIPVCPAYPQCWSSPIIAHEPNIEVMFSKSARFISNEVQDCLYDEMWGLSARTELGKFGQTIGLQLWWNRTMHLIAVLTPIHLVWMFHNSNLLHML